MNYLENDMIANCKKDVKRYRAKYEPFEYSKSTIRIVYDMLSNLGEKKFSRPARMTDESDEDYRYRSSNAVVKHVEQTIQAVAIKNNNFPMDIDFDIVFSNFETAIFSGKVDRYGYSNAELAKCFNAWISQPGTVDRLREAYFAKYPDKRARERQKESNPVENWTYGQIKEAYDNLFRLENEAGNMTVNGQPAFENAFPVFRESDGTETVFTRIKNEAKKRGIA